MTTGERVRRYRLRFKTEDGHRLTQEELADMTGIDRRYLGKIETGDIAEPGIETLAKVASALKIPVRYLADPRYYEGEHYAHANWEQGLMADESLDEVARETIAAVIKQFKRK